MMEDLSYTLEGEEARPKDISNLEWKNMNKKEIAYIRQQIDTHHAIAYVPNEKKMSMIYRRNWFLNKQKTIENNFFSLKKLVKT